ncbi:MAG: PEP-CTERM sorting domain-containing protein [Nitrosospira sp.]|nr:PEP-CTERM sorting domain-containing protein [Nitrosospira sp.]
MKKFRHSLLLILGAIGVGLGQAARAADNPVTATAASIDWSQLQLSVIGVGGSAPAVEFFSYNTTLNSSSRFYPEGKETDSASSNNWTSIVQTEANAGESRASGLASSDILSGMVNAVGQANFASSSGSREVSFSFDGPGVLTVSVPYSISLNGTRSHCWHCYDIVSVNGNAYFDNFTGGSNDSYPNSSVSYSLHSYSWQSLPEPQSGDLVFGIVASGAGTGSLGVEFNILSVVPEPESYAMLLTGLGLMGAVLRRRQCRKGMA